MTHIGTKQLYLSFKNCEKLLVIGMIYDKFWKELLQSLFAYNILLKISYDKFYMNANCMSYQYDSTIKPVCIELLIGLNLLSKLMGMVVEDLP